MLTANLPAAPPASTQIFAYFGTYTGANSKGIYVARFDTASGRLGALTLAAELTNPSYLAPHPNGRFLYGVSEVSQGSVSAFSIDAKTGMLTFLNRVASGGSGPCFARVEAAGKAVFVANYESGSFAVLPIEADGRLREASTVIQDKGKGANPSRQEGPHAHSLNPSPDNRFAIGADLGLDKLFVFRLDAAKGTLTTNDPPYWEAKPGSGPRHFVFHPNGRLLYSLQEEGSTLVTFDYDGATGHLTAKQTISSLPPGFAGTNFTSEVAISPDARFVYAANRLHDTIAWFAIAADGTLRFTGEEPTRGDYPRFFTFDPSGSFVYSCNQRADAIVSFRVNRKTGALTHTGQYTPIGTPSFLAFLALRNAGRL